MRSRFRGRRVRPPMQWIPNDDFGATMSLVSGIVNNSMLVDCSAGASTAAVPQIGRLTVLRIRGSINVVAPSVAGVWPVRMGICVIDSTQGVAGIDPSAEVQMDRDWLWVRTVVVQNLASGSDTYTRQPASELDVKVKRIMKPNTQLRLFAVQASGATATLYPDIRTLVSRVA